MKKTMLTFDTLTQFEKEYKTDMYTEEELAAVEHSAYVANMNRCSHPEWTQADVYNDFIRVLSIHHVELHPVNNIVDCGGIYERMNEALEGRKDRSAWNKGVTLYAFELVQELEERAACEGRNAEPGTECKTWMLNGAADWSQYSWGGSSLIYDCDIAERLCCPSELKKTRNGERRPNSREEWLDTQARALYQACNRVARLYRAISMEVK